jgi:hypothetical protein
MTSKLTHDQKTLLLRELKREDLSIFTSVRMANLALVQGDSWGAILHLKTDADKIRCYSKPLYDLVTSVTPCSVCGYNPKPELPAGENKFWECSHVECPNRHQITATDGLGYL